MQAPSRRVRVVAHHLLVKLDAEARLVGRDDVALLPAQPLAQNRVVKFGPDGLQDEEVRAGERDVRGRRVRDRAAVDVGRDLRVVEFRDDRDLARLPDAAAAPDVGLQDRDPGPQRLVELHLRGQAFAGRHRDRGGPRHLTDRVHLVRRARLLEPQRVVGFQASGETDGRRGGHLPVGTEQDVGPVSHRLTNAPDAVLAAGQFGQRKLPPALEAVWAGGILLERGEAHLHVLERALGRGVAVVVDVAGVLAGVSVRRHRAGIDVGVGADAVVEPAADESVDGLPGRLAENVPDRGLDTAEHPHHRNIGPLREPRGVHAPEQGLDVVRVFPGDVALEGVLHHPARDIAGEGDAVALADALDAVVGRHLHDDPERATDAGRRNGHPGRDVLKLHVVASSMAGG